MKTALNVSVLYQTYGGVISDCTNGGVTSKNERVILVPEGVAIPENASLPVLKVVRRNIGGKPYLHAEPVNRPGAGTMGTWMAGGNFLYSCDSRFRTWVSEYPISVHDRSETQEQYDLLSV